MCGPALLSLLALASSLALRSEKALAASTDGLASGVAQKMCAFGTALDNAAGEARALTEKLAQRRETAARNLGALTAGLAAAQQILNETAKAHELRSLADTGEMEKKARQRVAQLKQLMEDTITAGDAARQAAAGVKEYMRVLGTIARGQTTAGTCLNAEAKLERGSANLEEKLKHECRRFFDNATQDARNTTEDVLKDLKAHAEDRTITGSSERVPRGSDEKQTPNFGKAADGTDGKCNLFNMADTTHTGIAVGDAERVTYAGTIELQFHSTQGQMTLLGRKGKLAHNQTLGTIIETLQSADRTSKDGQGEDGICHVGRIDICTGENDVRAQVNKLIAEAMKKRDETLNQAHNELKAREEEHNNKDTQDGSAGTHKQSPGTRGDLEAPKAGESHTQTPASFANQHKLSHTTIVSLFASLSAHA
ncbi:hypothetical protein, conserved in T. vivax [Trypanosoma vivax Y486]|uniref:Uncharacterized protein n=1 Tax=Trypanosoma vivax (strain Y486) TaxID=1055687 RepID=F9WTK6_TRYVY|nr:hypothetical protein, conserved in T. vivax [Trypanosoma vivax Y486]|eukprot:CCD20899.1 hypothetical protein, conserved in T. vivax [Trypanosoma vivax Y486]